MLQYTANLTPLQQQKTLTSWINSSLDTSLLTLQYQNNDVFTAYQYWNHYILNENLCKVTMVYKQFYPHLAYDTVFTTLSWPNPQVHECFKDYDYAL